MTKLRKWISKLFSLSAFKLGFILTIFFIYISAQFYNAKSLSPEERNEVLDKSFVLQFLFSIHERTLDWRLLARGERRGSSDIVLVTVDENSLEKIGRWPWPRTKIAEIIESLMSQGAAAMGFDAVFSEPERNQALNTLLKIKEHPGLPESVTGFINGEIEKSNSDKILSQTVQKYTDQLVMGTYFDQAPGYPYPIQELCDDLISQNSSDFKLLEHEERVALVLDPYTAELPDALKQGLGMIFQNLAEDEKQKFLATAGVASIEALGENDRRDLYQKIVGVQKHYCFDFLSARDPFLDGHKQLWPQVQAQSEDLKALDFDAGLRYLRLGRYLIDAITPTGKWWLNVPEIAAVTKHTGYFNAFQDSDGSIRNTHLIVRYGGKYFPSLALKLAMIRKKAGLLVTLTQDPTNPRSKVVKELSFTNLETGDPTEKILVDVSGRLAINYAGPQNMFPHMSAAELFNNKDTVTITQRTAGAVRPATFKKSEFIKDKIFLFGATAVGIYDLRVTPFQENFPGLETHANALDNILRRDFLVPSPLEPQYMAYTLLLLGIALSFALKYLGAISGLVTTLMVLSSLYLTDRFYFFNNGVVVAILIPFLMVSAIYVTLTFYKYLTEERKKQALKGTFEKYVSPAIVNEILKDPSNLELGGKKQYMSVMFSDVRGFTTISEKLDPQVLTKILNTYLTPMTRLVFDNKGTLDKYMGDAIMAFFGAPIEYNDHAKMACRCALQMMSKLKELQADFKAKNLPEIDIGIGINTGDMNVGNMGSDIVRSYTVMGDAVNLGSRLEGINKQYGTHIIISEFTQKEVQYDFVTREVDWVRVKGKLLPVRIFELVGEKNLPAPKMELIKWFQEGFEHYHKQAWAQAIECFSRALNLDPSDSPTKLYLERCQEYIVEPPPADWDGVFEMKTK